MRIANSCNELKGSPGAPTCEVECGKMAEGARRLVPGPFELTEG